MRILLRAYYVKRVCAQLVDQRHDRNRLELFQPWRETRQIAEI